MSRPSVELRIGELVLVGLSAADGPRLVRALSDRLAELLGTPAPGAFTQSRSVARVDGGMLPVSADARPETLGGALADVVHRSVA